MTQQDFGLSKMNWADCTAEHVSLVEAEYKERLVGTLKAWEELEQKVRYFLTALVGLIAALTSFVFAQKALPLPHAAGLYTMVLMFWLAAAAMGKAVMPRTYPYLGVTPTGFDMSRWSQFLEGKADEREFRGMRMRNYADSILAAESSNSDKSKWMRYGILAAISAVPLAACVAAVLVFLDSPHVTVVRPALLAAIALAAGLVLGVAAGVIVGRRLPTRS